MLACFWVDGNRLMCVKSSYLQMNAFVFRDASEKHSEYLNKRVLMLCVHVCLSSLSESVSVIQHRKFMRKVSCGCSGQKSATAALVRQTE